MPKPAGETVHSGSDGYVAAEAHDEGAVAERWDTVGPKTQKFWDVLRRRRTTKRSRDQRRKSLISACSRGPGM